MRVQCNEAFNAEHLGPLFGNVKDLLERAAYEHKFLERLLEVETALVRLTIVYKAVFVEVTDIDATSSLDRLDKVPEEVLVCVEKVLNFLVLETRLDPAVHPLEFDLIVGV